MIDEVAVRPTSRNPLFDQTIFDKLVFYRPEDICWLTLAARCLRDTPEVTIESMTMKARIFASVALVAIVSVFAPSAASAVVPASYTPPSSGSTFHSVPVERLHDSREMSYKGAKPDRFGAGQIRVILVKPGATAAAVNVTVADAESPGFVTLFPCIAGTPKQVLETFNVSNLNIVPGQTLANFASPALNSAGELCVYSSARAHVIVDYSGYFSLDIGGDKLQLLDEPARKLDTRSKGVVKAGSTVALKVTDNTARVSTAVINVTAVSTAGPGFVTVYNCNEDRPTASNLNYAAGQTIANQAWVQVSEPQGEVCFYSSSDTHLIVDVLGNWGYFPGGAQYTPIVPVRVLDSRPKQALDFSTAFWVSKYNKYASAASVNVTVVDARGDGFGVAHDGTSATPTTSTLNYRKGGTVGASATTWITANQNPKDGKVMYGVEVSLSGGAASMIVDVFGVYA
jgi:hypothetical protein